MKTVSFEVAKYLKKLGLEQDAGVYYNSAGEVCFLRDALRRGYQLIAPAPLYVEAWLWLCDRGIVFYPCMYSAHEPSGYSCYYRDDERVLDYDNFGIHENPEEAIIAAIDYLCANKLIKIPKKELVTIDKAVSLWRKHILKADITEEEFIELLRKE